MPNWYSDLRIKNEFKVPQKSWGSWTIVAKHVFNKTMHSMMRDPQFYIHTELKDREVDLKHFRVTAWNAAYTAASICSRGERQILKDLTTRYKN